MYSWYSYQHSNLHGQDLFIFPPTLNWEITVTIIGRLRALMCIMYSYCSEAAIEHEKPWLWVTVTYFCSAVVNTEYVRELDTLYTSHKKNILKMKKSTNVLWCHSYRVWLLFWDSVPMVVILTYIFRYFSNQLYMG